MLEPLGAYLMIAGSQYEDASRAGADNVGPGDDDCITTGTLADLFVKPGERELPGKISVREDRMRRIS